VTERPAFWIVAGINGAGKSTATKSGRYGNCLNPDASAKQIERVVRWPLLANYAAVVYLERVVASSIAIEKSPLLRPCSARRSIFGMFVAPKSWGLLWVWPMSRYRASS
jgi:predicted ABC-type ATPase